MNRPTSVIEAFGAPVQRTTAIGYDKAGNPISVTDARGIVACYQYDAVNRVTTEIQDRNGIQATGSRTYDSVGNLTQLTDPNGNITSYGYDADNRQTTIVEAYGSAAQSTTVLAYDPVANISSLTDPKGVVTCYQYDALNRVTTEIQDRNGLQATTRMSYDAAGNLQVVTDTLNHVTTYQYDALNRVANVTNALNGVTTIVYDGNDNILSVIDPRGTLTCHQYDALNRLTTVIDDAHDTLGTNQPATTIYAYDSDGSLLSVTDPSGMVTCFQYDALNRLTTEVDDQADSGNSPLRYTTTFQYDANDNLVGMSDPLHHATSYAYDRLNRLTTEVDAWGSGVAATTVTTYDKNGNVLSVTDPTGTVTCYQYDALNRQTAQIDGYSTPVQEITTTLYDATDNLTTVVTTGSAGQAITSLSYDSLNRLASVQDANGNITSYSYYLNGQLKSVTDPLNHTTTYQYDALNRPTTVTNALNQNTVTGYDADGNVISITDADSNITTYQYDALNRLTTLTDPLNHTATFQYNSSGDLLSTTNRNHDAIDYQYDPLHRLTTEIWLSNSGTTVNTLVYGYDGANNMTTATSIQGSSSYTYTMAYDALNRMTSEHEPFGAALTAIGYDAAGDRTHVEDSFGGTTTYSYDALHRLATIQFNATGESPLRADFQYNRQDLLTTITRYSDLAGSNKVGISVYQYDPGMRLTTIQHESGSGTVLVSMVYSYDAASRVASQTIAGAATIYSYDALDQLTTVTTGSGTTTYGYDNTGNRNGPGYAVGSDNQMTSDGTWSYTYDAEGNVIKKQNPSTGETWNYTYDNLNELTGVTDVSGAGTTLMQATYVYDALGNRIEKDVWTQSSGTTTVTRFAYDGDQAWAQMSGTNALQNRYIDGGSAAPLLARESSTGTVGWYLTDHENSVTNITDSAGTIQDTVTYDAYGNFTESNAAYGDQFKYTGAQYDAETGLQYQGARYYDPKTGRWFSQDPLGFAAGDPNLYRYAGNDPTNYIDPSGTTFISAIWMELQKQDPAVYSYLKYYDAQVATGTSWFQSNFSYDMVYEYGAGAGLLCDLGLTSGPIKRSYSRWTFDDNVSADKAAAYIIDQVRNGAFRNEFNEFTGVKPRPGAEIGPMPGTADYDQALANEAGRRRDRMRDAGYSEVYIWLEAFWLPDGIFDNAVALLAPYGAAHAAQVELNATVRAEIPPLQDAAAGPADPTDRLVIDAYADSYRGEPNSTRPALVSIVGKPGGGRGFTGRAKHESELHTVVEGLISMVSGTYNGACAECQSVSRALYAAEARLQRKIGTVEEARQAMEGAVMRTSQIRKPGKKGVHAVPHAPCNQCGPMLKALGIQYQ